jgi:probable rRNA maturation factor
LNVAVTGQAIPRFSRRDIAAFTRRTVTALRAFDRLSHVVSDVSIAIVDDTAMQELNKRFRRKNRTTDVLTFPADESYADPKSKGWPLGDIAISIDQARRQAAEERHSLATEVRYLILHGLLHALGYDHETDKGEMNALELEVRAAVGLA